MLVPSCNDPSEIVTLDIQLNEIVKIIFHFSPGLNVLFLYNFKKCSDYIRESLDMKPKTSGGAVESKSAKSTFPYKTITTLLFTAPYYNPKDFLEPYKRIVLVLRDDALVDECKNVIKSVFQKNTLDEITQADATTLLDRSSSKDKFVALSK